MKLRYRVRVKQDEDGMFVVECPNLPGCISQGKTRAEALANIRDAIEGYLASLEKHGEPIPPPIGEEIVEVSTKKSSRSRPPCAHCLQEIHLTTGLQ